MHIYNIGYHSYEESEYVQLYHKEKFDKKEFEKKVIRATVSILKNIKDKEHITFQYVLDEVVNELIKNFGFKKVDFTSEFNVFGWADIFDENDWKDCRDEQLNLLTKELNKLKQKVYKPCIINDINMLPGDRNGSPDESLIFLDEGFVHKLSKYFSKEKSLKFDRIIFSKNLAEKEKLFCKKIFYYNAPPFQGNPPTKEEELRKEGYDRFIKKIKRNKEIVIREGRCQRLKIDGQFVFKQKAVDVFLAMDLTNIPINYPNIKRIILISSDSDFVPVIKNLEQQGIKTILYTYYEKKRNTNFSRSNELIKSVYKYVLLSKKDFENAPLKKWLENEK